MLVARQGGGGLSPMGSEPATWCGLVGGLTERERGTVQLRDERRG